VGERQQQVMEVAAAEVGGQHYHRPEGLSVEHCNDINKVPRDMSEVLTGESLTPPGNPYQDHSGSGG